jgi:hypothetical protein
MLQVVKLQAGIKHRDENIVRLKDFNLDMEDKLMKSQEATQSAASHEVQDKLRAVEQVMTPS